MQVDDELEQELETTEEVEGQNPETTEEDDGEDIITIGEESAPQDNDEEKQEAPEWVKELRKSHKQIQKENKELRKQLESRDKKEPTVQEVKKPTLEECDYDSELYDKKLEQYLLAKRAIDEEKENAQKAWNQTLQSYEDKKKTLKVKDFEDSEMIVQETLNETQQGIILSGAENPAIVIYALGKNEQKAKELAKIKDPIKFAFEVAKLETQMKVTRRRPSTEPEKIVTGTDKIVGGADKQLDKLRKDAERTGDFSKVIAYKKKMKGK